MRIGSRIRLFSIPDLRSRILDPDFSIPVPGSTSKNLCILSSRKYVPRVVHPGSRIRILTFYPSRIPDPGGQKSTGFRIPDSASQVVQIQKTGLWDCTICSYPEWWQAWLLDMPVVARAVPQVIRGHRRITVNIESGIMRDVAVGKWLFVKNYQRVKGRFLTKKFTDLSQSFLVQ